VPTNEDQYGPFRVGPAYPMFLRQVTRMPEAWHAMFGNAIVQVDYQPMEGARQSLGAARFPVEIRTLQRMAARWEQGLAQLAAAAAVTPPREQPRLAELWYGDKYHQCTCLPAMSHCYQIGL